MPACLAALRQIAQAGYPVGITVAPIMAVPGWEAECEDLRKQARPGLCPGPARSEAAPGPGFT